MIDGTRNSLGISPWILFIYRKWYCINARKTSIGKTNGAVVTWSKYLQTYLDRLENKACLKKMQSPRFIIKYLVLASIIILSLHCYNRYTINVKNCTSSVSRNAVRSLSQNVTSQNTKECENRKKASAPEAEPEVSLKPPVIITGCSSNHFHEYKKLVKSIDSVLRPKYGNLKIVFYDLGLIRKSERKFVLEHCKCEYRRFPFKKYPKYVKNLYNYAWKPIIVNMTMEEYGFIMWADTSIRFRQDNPGILDGILKKTLNPHTPVQICKGFGSIMKATKQYTFDALKVKATDFRNRPEVAGGWVFARKSDKARNEIIGPWAKCALKIGCLTTEDEKLTSCPKSNGKVGQCHRFDQSVLGIIMNKLYPDDYEKFSYKCSQYGIVERE